MDMPSTLSTRLQYQHKTLIDTIDGLTIDQMAKRAIDGKWSIFENIVHLQTYQHTFSSRVEKILEGNDPFFNTYVAENDPLFIDGCTKTTREVMHDMISVRKGIAAKMISLSTTDLVKKASHPVYGTMTLMQWLNFFLLHEAHHFFIIFKLAALLKKGANS